MSFVKGLISKWIYGILKLIVIFFIIGNLFSCQKTENKEIDLLGKWEEIYSVFQGMESYGNETNCPRTYTFYPDSIECNYGFYDAPYEGRTSSFFSKYRRNDNSIHVIKNDIKYEVGLIDSFLILTSDSEKWIFKREEEKVAVNLGNYDITYLYSGEFGQYSNAFILKINIEGDFILYDNLNQKYTLGEIIPTYHNYLKEKLNGIIMQQPDSLYYLPTSHVGFRKLEISSDKIDFAITEIGSAFPNCIGTTLAPLHRLPQMPQYFSINENSEYKNKDLKEELKLFLEGINNEYISDDSLIVDIPMH